MKDLPVRPEPTAGTPDGVAPGPDARVASESAASQVPGLTIISSKIERPRDNARVLTRPRLVGWLQQQRRARLILISAEAGYGKSTLLNDFSGRADETCMWYRLESSDADWITFLSHLVASVRRAFPGFGEQTEALLRHIAAMGPSREVVLATFLSDLSVVERAGAVLILDDYHLVDGSTDVEVILTRLLEHAPADMRFVLAGRGRPELALGRLTAQGRVAELTTSDLRFTRAEIEELFRSTYGQPLARETCDIVEERTEGWAASLQLVSASIATSRPSQVDQFIEALSGTSGPIYDFLAEEVLSRLASDVQRVLLHASMVDRVTPELVASALSSTPQPVPVEDVSACLTTVEALGLIGSQEDAADGLRIHPLMREFLEHQLALDTPPELMRAMHVAIAKSAEGTDWLVASRHFAAAGSFDDAMRVLGAAASEALGTGAWGGAAEVAASMPDVSPPPAVKVIKARALIDSGLFEQAIVLLASIDSESLEARDRALVGLTQAAALHGTGDSRRVAKHVVAIAASPESPTPLREVASAWEQMLRANAGGPIAAAGQALEALHPDLQDAGLHYFAGVTLHNLANTYLASGRYLAAMQTSRDAVQQLNKSSDAGGILSSTSLIHATAMAESGSIDESLRMAMDATSDHSATADSLAEAAWLCSVTGRSSDAQPILARLDRRDSRGSSELPSRAQELFARVAYLLARGEPKLASKFLSDADAIRAADIDGASRLAVVRAAVSVASENHEQHERVQAAQETCARQGAWRWMARARLLQAVVERDGDGLATWMHEVSESSVLSVLEVVDAIAGAIDLLEPHPDILEHWVLQAPGCWIPALGRQALKGVGPASTAASLVARFGAMADTKVLREYDRLAGGRASRRGLTKQLIKRVSPTVRVHDLGPSSYEVGDRRVVLSETRRKAAALLLFLITRPRLAATREQVMESLWPDQTPKSALNSLHQTLFFLRRDIEPWHEEGSTAEYVRMESDLVYLDHDLFQVDSVAFARQCADIMASRTAETRGPELLRLYSGRFAPEFEYEEWAEDWRTQLHASFLHLARTTAAELMERRNYSVATEVLTAATTIDMLAYDLRSMLVGSLAASGSVDAAQAQYQSMAALHKRDLGVEAQPFNAIVAEYRP